MGLLLVVLLIFRKLFKSILLILSSVIIMGKSKRLLVLLLLLFTEISLSSQLYVSIDDPVYSYLKRMEARGIIKDYNDSVLPLRRDEIAKYLKIIESNQQKLKEIEKRLLNEFLADYRIELTENQHPDIPEGKNSFHPFITKSAIRKTFNNIFQRENNIEEKHLLIYEESNNFIWIDFEGMVRSEFKEDQQRMVYLQSYILNSSFNDKLSIYFKYYVFSRKYNPSFTEPCEEEQGHFTQEVPGNFINFDNIHSSFSYHGKNFDIGVYHQPILWGNSFHNNLILSSNSSVFPYIGLSANWKGMRFSYIHASLLNDSTSIKSAPLDTRNRQKYFAGHRLDIPILDGAVKFGLSDIVIYGDRNMEISYLNPVNFFFAAEHTLQDRDNALLAFDIELNILQNTLLYGSLLLDECKLDEIGKKWWANKHVLQGGMRFSTHILNFPTDFQLEFTAARPWTYTHKTLTTNYTNNGFCLGFPYGPNSQLLFLRGETYLSRKTHLSLEFHNLKHGIDESDKIWGGDITKPYSLRDPAYDHSTDWLMGKIETTQRVKAKILYEIFNDSFLIVGFDYYLSELENNTQKDIFANIGIKINI